MADRETFVVLLLQQERDLRAFIGSLVLDRDAREDVFQECALTLWREFDRVDPAKSFGGWARGIAANMVLKRRHDDRRFPVAFSAETMQAVLDAYDRTEMASVPRSEALTDCVQQLPDHSRQLLAQRYEHERKPAEIAAATGRSLDSIYQALSRIRAKLEECIRRKLQVETGKV